MKKRDNMLSLPHYNFSNCPGLCHEQNMQPKCTQLWEVPFISKSMEKREVSLVVSSLQPVWSYVASMAEYVVIQLCEMRTDSRSPNPQIIPAGQPHSLTFLQKEGFVLAIFLQGCLIKTQPMKSLTPHNHKTDFTLQTVRTSVA